jgi:large subunit ribosomal protein L18
MPARKVVRRTSIKKRVRKHISGTIERPRLSVFRSNKQIYVQLIDDVAGKTVLAFSSRQDTSLEKMPKVDQAKEVGKQVAEKAISAGITTVVFDRNGYLYHGRIKSLAEGAREGGLTF